MQHSGTKVPCTLCCPCALAVPCALSPCPVPCPCQRCSPIDCGAAAPGSQLARTRPNHGEVATRGSESCRTSIIINCTANQWCPACAASRAAPEPGTEGSCGTRTLGLGSEGSKAAWCWRAGLGMEHSLHSPFVPTFLQPREFHLWSEFSLGKQTQ